MARRKSPVGCCWMLSSGKIKRHPRDLRWRFVHPIPPGVSRDGQASSAEKPLFGFYALILHVRGDDFQAILGRQVASQSPKIFATITFLTHCQHAPPDFWLLQFALCDSDFELDIVVHGPLIAEPEKFVKLFFTVLQIMPPSPQEAPRPMSKQRLNARTYK